MRAGYGAIDGLSAPERVLEWLSPSLRAEAPSGRRQAAWLAGRVLLAQMLDQKPLPRLADGGNGKPVFADGAGPFFSLSHSLGWVAAAVSGHGPVGCDIEMIRPRPGWPALSESSFCLAERQAIAALAPGCRLKKFWHIWTIREAVLKQRNLGVWSMADLGDVSEVSLQAQGLRIHHCENSIFSLAVCARHDEPMAEAVMEWA